MRQCAFGQVVLEAQASLPDDRTYRLVDTGGFDPEGKEAIPKAEAEAIKKKFEEVGAKVSIS